jgi:hypothetical protein
VARSASRSSVATAMKIADDASRARRMATHELIPIAKARSASDDDTAATHVIMIVVVIIISQLYLTEQKMRKHKKSFCMHERFI